MADDLDPSDIVDVEGIPMTVAQAKAASYSFDGEEPIPVESSTSARFAEDEDQATEVSQLTLRSLPWILLSRRVRCTPD